MHHETRVLGLDGCRGGWVAAGCSTDLLEEVTFTRVADRDLRAFLEPLAGADAIIAIDVPIGLADSEARACDRAARARLGAPRQNSVFSAPCRGTLAAADYLQACAINRDLRGRAISLETWGIMTKIALVDAMLEDLPQLAPQVWEAHPEVTFAELASSPRGIAARKKSADGLSERLTLLRAHGLHLDLDLVRGELGRANSGRTPFQEISLEGRMAPAGDFSVAPPGNVGRDDIVDAAACLLTAVRVARGQATFLPPGIPPYDSRSRRMQIVA